MVALLLASGLAPSGALGAEPRDRGTTACRKLPEGKRIVRLNLKPDTGIGDLVVWISSVTCRQFILPNTIPAAGKTVTIIAPRLLTPEEAYQLFLDALDSVGLTVYLSGSFFRVIESAKAHQSPIPVLLPRRDAGQGTQETQGTQGTQGTNDRRDDIEPTPSR